MRDKLIHKYFGVNLGIVWKTISESIPELKPVIETMLRQATGGEVPDDAPLPKSDRL